MPTPPKNLNSFESLVEVIKHLRGPEGCPWDKEQTHKTLTRFAIEEAHELADAIETGSKDDIKSELGDLLLQVVLHSEISRQGQGFDIYDVIQTLNEKMVRRHPHVFSDVDAKDSEKVKQTWEQIKAAEKAEKDNSKASFSFEIPPSLPSLLASFKIGEKTVKHNFDWDHVSQVLGKLKEEIAELEEAIASKDESAMEHEMGDVLFSAAQISRHLKIDPEQALRICNKRFETRFAKMQDLAITQDLDFSSLDSDQLEELWRQAKGN